MNANNRETAKVIGMIVCGLLVVLWGFPLATAEKPQCNDGIDNDGDARTDYPSDPDCDNKGDASEAAPPPPPPATQCNDGIDNDRDGTIDMEDDSCESKNDPYEGTDGITCDTNPDIMGPCPPRECNNGADDDGDGRVDEEDPGCWNENDETASMDGYPYHCEGPSSQIVTQVTYALCGIEFGAREAVYFAMDQL